MKCRPCAVVCYNVASATNCTRYSDVVCGPCLPGFFRDQYGNCESCNNYPPDFHPTCTEIKPTDVIPKSTPGKKKKEEEEEVKIITVDEGSGRSPELQTDQIKSTSEKPEAVRDVDVDAEEGYPMAGVRVHHLSNKLDTFSKLSVAFSLTALLVLTVLTIKYTRKYIALRTSPVRTAQVTHQTHEKSSSTGRESFISERESVSVDPKTAKATYVKSDSDPSQHLGTGNREVEDREGRPQTHTTFSVVSETPHFSEQQKRGKRSGCLPKPGRAVRKGSSSETDSIKDQETNPLLKEEKEMEEKESKLEQRRRRHRSNSSRNSEEGVLRHQEIPSLLVDSTVEDGSECEKLLPNNTSSLRMASVVVAPSERKTPSDADIALARLTEDQIQWKEEMKKKKEEQFTIASQLARGKRISDLLNDRDKTDDVDALLTPTNNDHGDASTVKDYRSLLKPAGIDYKYQNTVRSARQVIEYMQKTGKDSHDISSLLIMIQGIDRGDVVDELCEWICQNYGCLKYLQIHTYLEKP
ncbi:uncharacterized protein [Ptychodera flava]|uniref:uncharacterized protein n=1 Tax=Ptychodera flava TaxID=63121 RepID=UPI00396A3490